MLQEGSIDPQAFIDSAPGKDERQPYPSSRMSLALAEVGFRRSQVSALEADGAGVGASGERAENGIIPQRPCQRIVRTHEPRAEIA